MQIENAALWQVCIEIDVARMADVGLYERAERLIGFAAKWIALKTQFLVRIAEIGHGLPEYGRGDWLQRMIRQFAQMRDGGGWHPPLVLGQRGDAGKKDGAAMRTGLLVSFHTQNLFLFS